MSFSREDRVVSLVKQGNGIKEIKFATATGSDLLHLQGVIKTDRKQSQKRLEPVYIILFFFFFFFLIFHSSPLLLQLLLLSLLLVLLLLIQKVTNVYTCLYTSIKGAIFLKNRNFILQERFNKLIYGINIIIKCGI